MDENGNPGGPGKPGNPVQAPQSVSGGAGPRPLACWPQRSCPSPKDTLPCAQGEEGREDQGRAQGEADQAAEVQAEYRKQ